MLCNLCRQYWDRQPLKRTPVWLTGVRPDFSATTLDFGQVGPLLIPGGMGPAMHSNLMFGIPGQCKYLGRLAIIMDMSRTL